MSPTVKKLAAFVFVAAAAFVGCSGGGGGNPPPSPGASAAPTASLRPSPTHTLSPTPSPTPTQAPPQSQLAAIPYGLVVSNDDNTMYAEIIEAANGSAASPAHHVGQGEGNSAPAGIARPRQLAALPNGDLVVGTLSSNVYVIPGAENAGAAYVPSLFATLPDPIAQGVTYSPIASAIYVATRYHVYKFPYVAGQLSATTMTKIFDVRNEAGGDKPSSHAPSGDTDNHVTTSVLAAGNYLYISVGSSCNACVEDDPQKRAVIIRTDLNGNNAVAVATRIRNAVALAVDPANGDIWVAGAGQDCLLDGTATCSAQDDRYAVLGHPLEYADNLSLAIAAAGGKAADYGWPICDENAIYAPDFKAAYPTVTSTSTPRPNPKCTNGVYAHQAIPLVEFPAYSTHLGLAIYPSSLRGTYANAGLADSLIITNHGSWHEDSSGLPVAVPAVNYVPLTGERPTIAYAFTSSEPTNQYQSLIKGYQDSSGVRLGQPVGVAIGAQGSVFIADDAAGIVIRLRPGSGPSSSGLHRSTFRSPPLKNCRHSKC